MKRLREMPASSPLIDQAQRLIEAAPVLPESTALKRMQQIRRAIDQPRPRGSSLVPRFPAFAVAGAVLLFGAGAFAGVRTWVEHRAARPAAPKTVEAPRPLEREAASQLLAAGEPALAEAQPASKLNQPLLAADQPERSQTRPASRQRSTADQRGRTRGKSALGQKQKVGRGSRQKHPSRAARSAVAQATTPPKSAVPKSAVLESPAIAPPQAAEVGSRAAASPIAAETEAQATALPTVPEAREELAAIPEPARLSPAAKRSSDSELVVRAVQTLRRDHDPALASRLLERYRVRNPAGVLAEEVLSLQIEAAVTADDPRAPAFAREYLARYPDGRYRERAARALGGGAP